MHAPVELGQALEVVIGLGVDVDDELPRRSAWKASSSAAIVLPDPSVPASRIDGGRPVRDASVMSKRTGRAPPVERAADVDAALGAGLVRADRHQRAELLDRQHVGVVADRAAVRARQVVEEQRRLQPERPVQRDRAEAVRAAPRRAARARSRDGAPTASEIAAFSSGGRSCDCR